VLANDVLPTPDAGVTLRVFHAAMRFRDRTIDGGMRADGMDLWPKEWEMISFASAAKPLVSTGAVTVASGRTSGFGVSTGVIAPLEKGRTYTAFVFAEDGGPEAVRICDDLLADVNLRALCVP
jgi:hypothetical protein